MTSSPEQQVGHLLDRLAAARASGLIAESTEQNVRLWLTEPAYAAYRPAVAEHIGQGKFRELDDAFWTVLPFGTGGRRGKMYPIGTNVMNERTVGESAQGLADYLKQQLGEGAARSCAIAYDTRNNSRAFARLSAEVLAANGVRVFIFTEHRSTPQLSFAVRHLEASAGIVISASHNPPSDNGFKCYWSSGGQVLPPHDAGIIRCVEAVREVRAIEFDRGVEQGLIAVLGPEHDTAYVCAVVSQSLNRERAIRIVYTPLHGVGMTSVARVLEQAGFSDVHVVTSQATPDGNFPNVAGQSPNPENPAALREAIELAGQVSADLVLASDPDADRIAAAVPDAASGQWVPLTGNQLAGLLAHYVLSKRQSAADSAPGSGSRPFVVKTRVTTDLIARVADSFGVTTYGDLPVGFKWIGAAIDRHGPEQFLFGAEESLGYLCGTYARDKDAAVAALLAGELAAELKAAGKTMLAHLDELYLRYGYHLEQQISRTRPGREGAAEIARVMRAFRQTSRLPRQWSGMSLESVYDFAESVIHSFRAGDKPTRPAAKPRSDQVMLCLDQPGWRVIARPSGTEPKIKFYLFGVVSPQQLSSADKLGAAKREAAGTMDRLIADLDAFVAGAVS
jgi:phosphoglucomutase/phosphomannomutase